MILKYQHALARSRNGRLCMTSRPAMALLEIIVAATLITTGLAVIAKLTIASGRMWMQTRHERLALEELSNQLELLVAMQRNDRDEAIANLTPSPHITSSLVGASLEADFLRDQDGSRIALTIRWGDQHEESSDEEQQSILQGRTRQMSLVGWVDPADNDLILQEVEQ